MALSTLRSVQQKWPLIRNIFRGKPVAYRLNFHQGAIETNGGEAHFLQCGFNNTIVDGWFPSDILNQR